MRPARAEQQLFQEAVLTKTPISLQKLDSLSRAWSQLGVLCAGRGSSVGWVERSEAHRSTWDRPARCRQPIQQPPELLPLRWVDHIRTGETGTQLVLPKRACFAEWSARDAESGGTIQDLVGPAFRNSDRCPSHVNRA